MRSLSIVLMWVRCQPVGACIASGSRAFPSRASAEQQDRSSGDIRIAKARGARLTRVPCGRAGAFVRVSARGPEYPQVNPSTWQPTANCLINNNRWRKADRSERAEHKVIALEIISVQAAFPFVVVEPSERSRRPSNDSAISNFHFSHPSVRAGTASPITGALAIDPRRSAGSVLANLFVGGFRLHRGIVTISSHSVPAVIAWSAVADDSVRRVEYYVCGTLDRSRTTALATILIELD